MLTRAQWASLSDMHREVADRDRELFEEMLGNISVYSGSDGRRLSRREVLDILRTAMKS